MEGVWLGLGAGNWMYVLFDVAARGPIDSTRQKKPEGRRGLPVFVTCQALAP